MHVPTLFVADSRGRGLEPAMMCIFLHLNTQLSGEMVCPC